MGKRHRQPEPIDILNCAPIGKPSETLATLPSLTKEVFPATPAALRRRQRQQAKAVAPPVTIEDAADASSSSVTSLTGSDDLAYDTSDYDGDGNQQDDNADDIFEEDSSVDTTMRRAVRQYHRQQLAGSSEEEEDGNDVTDVAECSSSDDSYDDDDSDFDDEEGDVVEEHSEVEDDESEDDGGGLVTVDFGVYDMAQKHVNAVMHLMDQLCPDKLLEVNRDDLGAALAENPYSYIVKVNNNETDDESTAGDEEEEIYGLVSVLDVTHGIHSHPNALKPLMKILKDEVWRTVSPGMPPAEILLDTADHTDKATGVSPAKCVLLVAEYIRNVPLELTVQILEDLTTRLDSHVNSATQAVGSGKRADAVVVNSGCMFAVLAKVQRAQDAPVTLKGKSTEAFSNAGPAQKKSRRDGGTGCGSSKEPLDLSAYIFWREEDNLLFDFRDKRVASVAYKCRPQYEGQPEQEFPVSLLFVLQYGALLQAIAEMKRRENTKADVMHY